MTSRGLSQGERLLAAKLAALHNDRRGSCFVKMGGLIMIFHYYAIDGELMLALLELNRQILHRQFLPW
jgi:hypothetical protein